VTVYYARINEKWNEDSFKEKMSCLPSKMQQEVMMLVRWQDRQLTVGGKLLLLTALHDFNLSDILQLKDLVYNQFGRPYFNAAFDFNISHTADMVVCAASTTSKTGIDIEKIQPINIDDFEEYFTVNEINTIKNSVDKTVAFYETWTKKEAFIKAVGEGLNTNLHLINTTTNVVTFNDILYYLYKADIKDGYVCHICTTKKDLRIIIKEVPL
jgi:4'-phosphopantetheinyl transferase